MFPMNCYSTRVSFADAQYKADFYRPMELTPFFTHNGLVLIETLDDKQINESVNVMDEQGILVGIFSVVLYYTVANGLSCGSVFSPHYAHLVDNSIFESSAIFIDQTAVDTFYVNTDLHFSVDFKDSVYHQSAFLPPLLISYANASVVISNLNDPAEIFFSFPCDVQYMTNLFNNDESVDRTIYIKGYPFTFVMDSSIIYVMGYNFSPITYPNTIYFDTRSLSALFVSSGGGSFDLIPVLDAIAQLGTIVANIDQNVSNTGDMLQLHVLTKIDSIHAEIGNINIDLSPVETLIGTDYQDLVTKIDTITHSINLSSLDGNGSEYMDGVLVKVYGRDMVYSVARSYMSLTDNNAYTAVYDLVSTTGAKLTVPESLLSLYVAPVITP